MGETKAKLIESRLREFDKCRYYLRRIRLFIKYLIYVISTWLSIHRIAIDLIHLKLNHRTKQNIDHPTKSIILLGFKFINITNFNEV